MYPTAWRLIRLAATDHDIAGARVQEGEHVLIGTHAIHRSAAVWDRPLDFCPPRWEQPTDAQRRSYLPFGKGDGMRPANGFAVKALEHLAHLILHSHQGHVHLRTRKLHVRTLLAPPAGWTRLTPAPATRVNAFEGFPDGCQLIWTVASSTDVPLPPTRARSAGTTGADGVGRFLSRAP
ncbi:cytochrome P450 [Streptomyces niveus]|uniref:cytochrome P450 n=1 Tax=Streptomyces niveus TaxID=193462 RepID=UPI003717CEDF